MRRKKPREIFLPVWLILKLYISQQYTYREVRKPLEEEGEISVIYY